MLSIRHDSMICRCHCQITAILPQKRKNGRAGGPSRWAAMMVSHHLPLVGIELLGHQRVRDRHWTTSERGAYSLRALTRYHRGVIDIFARTPRTTAAAAAGAFQCLLVTPGGILPSQYGPHVAAGPRQKQCATTGHPDPVTVPWKGAEAKSAYLSRWKTVSELRV
jgi:hypothetical protein